MHKNYVQSSFSFTRKNDAKFRCSSEKSLGKVKNSPIWYHCSNESLHSPTLLWSPLLWPTLPTCVWLQSSWSLSPINWHEHLLITARDITFISEPDMWPEPGCTEKSPCPAETGSEALRNRFGWTPGSHGACRIQIDQWRKGKFRLMPPSHMLVPAKRGKPPKNCSKNGACI